MGRGGCQAGHRRRCVRGLADRVSHARADQARLAAQLDTGAVLVQSSLPEIEGKGEWSLVFLGLEYSHAVLKQPRNGDFRVQEHLGGRTMPAKPGLIRGTWLRECSCGSPAFAV